MVKFRKVDIPRVGEVCLEKKSRMENWRYIQPVLGEFARKWNIFISVRNPHGEESDPLFADHTLFIRFFSNSSTGRYAGSKMPFLPSAYGIHLERDANGDAVDPSGAGETITCQPGRRVVAEIVEGTLFVLFDLPHPFEDGKNSDSGVLMRRILNDFGRSESFSEMREKWVAPLPRTLGRKEIEEMYWTHFRQFFRRGRRFEMSEEKIRQCFEELKNAVETHKGVLGVEPDRITVTLGPIWHVGDSILELQIIGKYDFVMFPETGGVSFFHTTPKAAEHPHDLGGGSVCLGSISGSMEKLVTSKQFDLAVALAYDFLRTG